MSIRDPVSDDSPIFITRLVADSGWIITGGAAQVGSVGVTVPTRSATSCRAFSWSVPGLKYSVMDDSRGTDFERIVSRFGSPWSACSRGTVTSSSVSLADSPRVMVWISTRGGANSGKTSTGESRSCRMPMAISAAAPATTRNRNLMLDPTSQRIMAGGVPSKLLVYPELGAVQLGRPDDDDSGSGRRPLREKRKVSVDAIDGDGLPDEDERLGARIRERHAVRLVEHRSVGNGRLLGRAARCLPFLNRGRLDVEPAGRLLGQGDAHEVRALDLLEHGWGARFLLPPPASPPPPQ